jgi:hypothetical protein
MSAFEDTISELPVKSRAWVQAQVFYSIPGPLASGLISDKLTT